MLTNCISITKLAPIYPRNHVLTLLERTQKLLPSVTEGKATDIVCALFNVVSISALTDWNSTLRNYELEPALSSYELHTMAARISPFCLEAHRKQKADPLWVARNILNSVPKKLDDLRDYIPQNSLSDINGIYLMEALTSNVDMVNKQPFYDDIVGRLTEQQKAECGGEALDMVCRNDVDLIDGITLRQKILGRAAEYYLIHRYGYEAASLWIANFINPSTYCMCNSVGCELRNFGFVDVEATVSIVENCIPFLIAAFEVAEIEGKKGEDSDGCEDTATQYADLILYGIEALLLLDQQRLEGKRISALLDTLAANSDFLSDVSAIRMIKFLCVFIELYDSPSKDELRISTKECFDLCVDSIEGFNDLLASDDFKPSTKDLILCDAQNFAAAGSRLKDTVYGVMLHNLFLRSIVDSESYEILANHVAEILEGEADLEHELDEQTRAVFEGFMTNLSDVMAFRSRVSLSHCKSLTKHSWSDRAKLHLAEIGHPDAMEFALEKSKTEDEASYWRTRIKAADKRKWHKASPL